MRVIFGAMFFLSAALGCLFMLRLGRPARTGDPTMAWLQHGLAATAVAFDLVIAFATVGIHVPTGLVLIVAAAQDAVFAWRLIALERSRRAYKETRIGQDR